MHSCNITQFYNYFLKVTYCLSSLYSFCRLFMRTTKSLKLIQNFLMRNGRDYFLDSSPFVLLESRASQMKYSSLNFFYQMQVNFRKYKFQYTMAASSLWRLCLASFQKREKLHHRQKSFSFRMFFNPVHCIDFNPSFQYFLNIAYALHNSSVEMNIGISTFTCHTSGKLLIFLLYVIDMLIVMRYENNNGTVIRFPHVLLYFWCSFWRDALYPFKETSWQNLILYKNNMDILHIVTWNQE